MTILLLDNGDRSIDEIRMVLQSLGATTDLYYSDEIEVEEVQALAPERIILGSGEGTPADAGISLPLIRDLGIDIPILGLGLGSAAIVVAFGGRIVDEEQVSITPVRPIHHIGEGLCEGLPSPVEMHVFAAPTTVRASLPGTLETIAEDADGQIMAVRHRNLPTTGLMFQPERWASGVGQQILRTFLSQH